MARGKIKFFNEEKGFGFIQITGEKDIFFHINNYLGDGIPQKDMMVDFQTRQGKKGPEAWDISNSGQVSPSSVNSIPRQKASDQRAKNPNSLRTEKSFPYGFVRREVGKNTPQAFHDQLLPDRYDIAFEIAWTTVTPTALMPCEDVSKTEHVDPPTESNGGYNKRWLMLDNRLAISPFTVKGAIAKGFADLLGGCYRVPGQIQKHGENATAEGFPYTGRWKRYRVAMNKSHAGIVREIDPNTGKVVVQPVVEYYYDRQFVEGFNIAPGEKCYAKVRSEKNKNFADCLSRKSDLSGPNVKELVYHGPYRFGMNCTLKPGDMNKKHVHRFYRIGKNEEVSGIIPSLNFAEPERMAEQCYGGIFCKNDLQFMARTGNPRKDLLGGYWHQDLRNLKPGDWCYYTTFKDDKGRDIIAGIGKNFQFKTFFSLEDAMPHGNRPCNSLINLCPRCSMFGLAVKDEDKTLPVGYAGRFRAGSLVLDREVTEYQLEDQVPDKNGKLRRVSFTAWHDAQDNLVARQYALPVMGPPKPSKRDANGYYDKDTGLIKGAKRYAQGRLDFDRGLPSMVGKCNGHDPKDYRHDLRPIAAICREGLVFTGTVGVQNCSAEEAAALLALLDERVCGNSFKLGLGKALGLGGIKPLIQKLWVRRPDDYQWQSVPVPEEGGRKEVFTSVRELCPKVAEKLRNIINDETLQKKIAKFEQAAELDFPDPGCKYWQNIAIEVC